MLPLEHRLRKDQDIKALFAKGKSVFVPGCVMRLRRNNLSVSRFAFVAGTKVSKSAVVRNRLRRQMRAIVHEHLGRIHPGYDVAFLSRKETLDRSFSELTAMIVACLKKSKLL